MASQVHIITLYCEETGEFITTRANKKRRNSYGNKDFKLALMKFSKALRKKVLFKETKKLFKRK